MEDNRVYKLERIGEKVQVVQLYIDGFDQLTTQQKIFIYYISKAVIAGRDIAYDQRNKYALETRNLFEDLYQFFKKVDDIEAIGFKKDTFKNLEIFIKQLWVGNGPFDAYTGMKIVCPVPRDELQKMIEYATSKSPLKSVVGGNVSQQLDKLTPLLYNENWRKIITDKSPNTDWIKESAVNFYSENFGLEQVKAFIEKEGADRYPLNSSLVLDESTGDISVEIWRAGCVEQNIPPGKYAKELSLINEYLEKAIPYASGEIQKEAIRKLIKFFKTGEENDFREYNITWVQDFSQVDFILGFIEVYLDPMGGRGEYEGCLYWKDLKLTTVISQIGENAQYFEDRMPWDEKYKKKDVKPLDASVVQVVMGAGGAGPVSSIGVNLPNEEQLREKYGSKSIVLNNVSNAYDKATKEVISQEFCFDQNEIDSQVECGSYVDSVATALHEVLGHASGKCFVEDPSKCLPGYYSTLEEARADLCALWHIFDPKLIELGVIPNLEYAKQLFRQEIRNALLTQLKHVEGNQLEEDHMKNRQLIANFILQNSKAIERRERDGKTYFCVVDFDEARKQVGILLSELQKIKAEGDLESAKKLIDTYGLYVDTQLRDQVKQRIKKLDIPSYSALVMPTLSPVYNDKQVVDIKVTYDRSFSDQMLEFSNKL
ncbi:hypothetical protein CYY_001837 [Polysphondylium violaceum]|uniref:Dipeptidyl-peptidase III n=1 Tax=Polysphondylium violaceum TaxID=133409 RepID=A0A8J4Q0Z3_9MYCE|nr:hypothetical protein CYY_001837 [Polysphondylium violaceum]